jgi:hypothetical protein
VVRGDGGAGGEVAGLGVERRVHRGEGEIKEERLGRRRAAAAAAAAIRCGVLAHETACVVRQRHVRVTIVSLHPKRRRVQCCRRASRFHRARPRTGTDAGAAAAAAAAAAVAATARCRRRCRCYGRGCRRQRGVLAPRGSVPPRLHGASSPAALRDVDVDPIVDALVPSRWPHQRLREVPHRAVEEATERVEALPRGRVAPARVTEVPLPHDMRGVTAAAQLLGQRRLHAVEAGGRGAEEHRGDAGAERVAPRQKGGARGRAHGVHVEVLELHPRARHLVQRGREHHAAVVVAHILPAQVIDHHHHQVGRRRRRRRSRPAKRGGAEHQQKRLRPRPNPDHPKGTSDIMVEAAEDHLYRDPE